MESDILVVVPAAAVAAAAKDVELELVFMANVVGMAVANVAGNKVDVEVDVN